ncbi:aminopeptidase N-like [Linepithema humile]|uniref:aminopeptidase N-like n=1 Tax=Linepithema humile TaxID=83485 RepID=UPI00062342B2|nr:PREDICTED: aminopeptidase N-like [Linepithema humile]
MANLQVILKCALILIIATAFSNSQYYLPEEFNFNDKNVLNPFPIHYDVELTLQEIDNTSNNYFNVSGNVSITFKIIKPIISFEINIAQSINVHTSSMVMKSGIKDDFNWTTKLYTNELSSYQEFVFTEVLQPEIYIMTLEFTDAAHDNEKGFFRVSYKMRKFRHGHTLQWLIATNSQPNGVHQMFPCFEQPEARATFNISVKVHNRYQILSNMGTQHDHFVYPDGMQIKHFATTPRIPVYQVAILIYNFNYINEIKYTLQDKIYSRNSEMHVYHAKDVIGNVTFHLQRKWDDIKKKWNPIINYALIPGFYFDSADAWRLVFLREAKVMYNHEIDTYGRKIDVAKFVAQKVVRQWLGGIISFSNWSTLWFDDSLAIFFGIDAANKTFPELQLCNLFVVQDMHDALYVDVNSYMKPLYAKVSSIEIDTTLGFARYLKAPALIRMAYYMTSMLYDIFETGVSNYFNKTFYEPPTLADFWNTIQSASDERFDTSSKFKNKTLKVVMDTWLENNYPIINVKTFLEDGKDILVKVTQENSHKQNWHKWWILITWFTDNLLSYSDRISPSLSKWLRPEDEIKTVTTLDSTNGWIIINTKRTGYYRVFYDIQNLRRIGWFLESNPKGIHVLNRAQLIDDAFYFLLTTKLAASRFFDLTKFLARDTDYIAWYPMFKALEHMSPTFAFNSNRTWEFKMHLLNLLESVLDKIGYEAQPNEDELTECLREEAAKWACLLGGTDCIAKASAKLDWHLQNREENKLTPGWKKWTFCTGVITGDSLIWHNAARAWDEERDDALLEYLMCSEDYYIATQSFRTLNDESIIKHSQLKDNVMHYMYFLAKYSNHTIIIDDIFEEILEKRPSAVTEIAGLITIINNIYTTDGLDKVEKYATDKKTEEALLSMILIKIATRKSYFSKVDKYAHIITKPVNGMND